MYTTEYEITTRYGETDQMGIIYHANYINYYEVARTEMIKTLGYSYRTMESEGIMMPVIEIQSHYLQPAHYDERLTIRTTLKEMPAARITFYYEIFNTENILINTGLVTLAFMNTITRRPCRPPQKLIFKLQEFFSK